ncbi:MAG: hypothetical protein JXA93_07440 [Anaerolineae bacterium]|nr:hypothetical protein [Anaerolineae bacterium]
MPGFAVRDVECILCRRQFSLMTADFILPWTLICDECLDEIWEMEGEDLTAYLAAAHGAGNLPQTRQPVTPPAQPHPLEREIIGHLGEMKQRWATAQDAIRARSY